MTITDAFAVAAHTVAACLIGYGLFAGYRLVRERSEALGTVLALGMLARIALGVALFTISYGNLPIARSLHTGNGFWELAVDARHYYNAAATALGTHSFAPDPLAPSPFFVWVLTIWMFIVGVTPSAGMFLNLCLYVALAMVVTAAWTPVNDWRRDLPCIVLLTAYSFLPVVLIHSTQPLKDELFNVILTTACLGVLALRRLIYQPRTTHEHWRTAAGALAVAVATCGAAGVRWYDGFIMWGALAVVLAWFLVRGRTTPLLTYLGGSVAVLIVVWLGFWSGSGRNYFLAAQMLNPARLLNVTQVARIGFLSSGGGTNITAPLHGDAAAGNSRYAELMHAIRTAPGAQERVAAEAEYLAEVSDRSTAHTAELESSPSAAAPSPPPAPPAPVAAAAPSRLSPTPPAPRGAATASAAPPGEQPPSAPTSVQAEVDPVADNVAVAVPVRPREQVAAAARGLAVIFVPISLLRTVTSIRIEGGRGLLSIVDFDTVVMDAVSIFLVALLWRRRRAIGDRLPLVLFGLTLSLVTALLVGYVVTNLGTLWRLRSLIALPLWIPVIALAPRSESRREHPVTTVRSGG